MTIYCDKCNSTPLSYEYFQRKTYCCKCISSLKRYLFSDDDIDKLLEKKE